MKKQEFGSLCLPMFKSKLDDVAFMDALAGDLSFPSQEELINFMNSDTSVTTLSRPLSDPLGRQCAYDF